MDKEIILSKYKKHEDKLLISKFLDKIELTAKTSKINTTDFYNESELAILKNIISLLKIENCIFYGGFDNCERKLIIIYPEKMKDLLFNGNFKFDTIISVFRIIVPKENKSFFSHSTYLGGLIKLGIKREKIGDIIVFDDGADIIVKKEIDKFLYTNLSTLTRFGNSEINAIKVDDIMYVEKKFKEFKIITSSLRLDNIVAELAKTSRNKATEILDQERVFVNYECECKNTKLVCEGDVITIRGKGKFIISEVAGNTKKGNFVVVVMQYN